MSSATNGASSASAALATYKHRKELAEMNEAIAKGICYAQLCFIGLWALVHFRSHLRHALSSRFLHGRHLRKASVVAGSLALQESASNGNSFTVNSAPATPYIIAIARSLHNKLLLRPLAFVGLTTGQLCVLALYSGLLITTGLWKVVSWEGNPRRFGWIAIAQCPAIYVLAMKNNPLTIFIDKDYAKLNFVHRFAGRMLLIFGVIHGGFFYNKHIKMEGKIPLSHPVLLTGTLALIFVSAIFVTGLRPFRSRFYQLFLITHIISYLGIIGSLWYHAPPARPYLYVAIAAICIDAVMKGLHSHVKRAALSPLPGRGTKIEVEKLGGGWRAGQHVWIRIFSRHRTFEKHPFTIANAPSGSSLRPGDGQLVLVAGSYGDYTKYLHGLALSNLGDVESKDKDFEKYIEVAPKAQVPVLVEGPYGAGAFHDFTLRQHVVLIGGGTGFTWVLSTLEDIIGCRLKGLGVTETVSVVWAIRDADMYVAFEKDIARLVNAAQHAPLRFNFQLHITRGGSSVAIQNVDVHQRRPQLGQVLQTQLNATLDDIKIKGVTRGSGIGVGVCAAQSMADACRNEVAKLSIANSTKVGGVYFYSEGFGW